MAATFVSGTTPVHWSLNATEKEPNNELQLVRRRSTDTTATFDLTTFDWATWIPRAAEVAKRCTGSHSNKRMGASVWVESLDATRQAVGLFCTGTEAHVPTVFVDGEEFAPP